MDFIVAPARGKEFFFTPESDEAMLWGYKTLGDPQFLLGAAIVNLATVREYVKRARSAGYSVYTGKAPKAEPQ